jgi:hypothetical protein
VTYPQFVGPRETIRLWSARAVEVLDVVELDK